MAYVSFPVHAGVILHPTDRAILVKIEAGGKVYAKRHQLRKKTRKRVVKLLMASGMGRNAANSYARQLCQKYGGYSRGCAVLTLRDCKASQRKIVVELPPEVSGGGADV